MALGSRAKDLRDSFGSLLLLGGKLGDLFGRKWTLVVGLVGFSLASAIGGLAQSFGVLIAARTLQGAFGALLVPSALGLLTAMFEGSPARPGQTSRADPQGCARPLRDRRLPPL